MSDYNVTTIEKNKVIDESILSESLKVIQLEYQMTGNSVNSQVLSDWERELRYQVDILEIRCE
eukprot:Pgem_evm1s10981